MPKKKKRRRDIYCPYCGSVAVKRSAWKVYGDDPPEEGAEEKELWVCSKYPDCDSYVSADKNGKPMGMLADKELRHLRIVAHRYFDEIYKNKIMSRSQSYRLLADRLAIPHSCAHIASFNTYRCTETISMAKEILHNHPKTKEWFDNTMEGGWKNGNDEKRRKNV